MNTHELAEELAAGPKRKVTASVDLSYDDRSATYRCFGSELAELVHESNGYESTLLFTDGDLNYGWTCVDDELPPNKEPVFIRPLGIAFMEDGKWMQQDGMPYGLWGEITHWMPTSVFGI